MFGTFQQSQMRVEIESTASQLSRALLQTASLRRWLLPQVIPEALPEELSTGLTFTSWAGCIPVAHNVDAVGADGVRLLLSRGIDGVHEWHWGEGWVQSCLVGVSYLPLQAGNAAAMLRLKTYLALPDCLKA